MIKLVKYLCVGGVSAIVYFVVFTLCFRFIGMGYMVAISVGYIISVVVHFCGNRYFTFHAGLVSTAKSLVPKYGMMLACNYGISLLVMNILVTKAGYSPYLGVVASIAATVTSGFLLAKYWVFVNTRKDSCAV